MFDANESFSLIDLGITSLNIKTIDFDKPNGITVASGAQLIRKARYELTSKKAGSYRHNSTGGNMFLTSFETDLARYKTSSGELIVVKPETESSGDPKTTVQKFDKTASAIPKLRGQR